MKNIFALYCFLDSLCDIIKVQREKHPKKENSKKLMQKAERQVFKMNAEMNFERKTIVDETKEQGLVSENCNCSIFTMSTVVCGVLLAVGAVAYALFTM